MKRCKRAIALAAGLLVVSAVPLSAGGAAYAAAVNADEARRVAMVRAQDLQGDAKSMDLDFLPPTEGAAGGESPTPPGKWILPGVERVPDDLARNAPPSPTTRPPPRPARPRAPASAAAA